MLVLFAVLGMMLMVSAGNLVMLYLGLELLALSSYGLVAMDRDNPLASEAAMKYFVLGSMASGLLLYGMSMVYGATGSLQLEPDLCGRRGQAASPCCSSLGVVFMLAGIAFKFGAAPFHMWLPDVYQGAPTAVTAVHRLGARSWRRSAWPTACSKSASARMARVAACAGRAGGCFAGDRQPDRPGTDQPQAAAGVFDHLPRRLPVAGPGRAATRPATPRRCSMPSATR